MGRKEYRVPVALDSKGIPSPSEEEIALILRGADELIGTGGRNLLCKVLKGSREKKVLKLGLDASPAYGALRELSLEQVLARIDWLIENRYLAIEYDYRLPLLVYTRAGWEIEKATFAREKLARLDAQIAAGELEQGVGWLNDMNPQVMHCILDMIEAEGQRKHLPALQLWKRSASRKVGAHIRQVLRALG
jgi:superfamily II DNA helicase RecQ